MIAVSPAMGQWHFPTIPGPLPNSASLIGPDCFEITTTSTNRGVVWDSNQIDLSLPFDVSFTHIASPFGGADGVAFVLQQQGLNAFGPGGHGLGYGNTIPPDPNYNPILPSVAVELDCHNNQPSGVNDIPADHIAVHTNGNLATASSTIAAAIPNGSTITDSVCRPWRITWAPAPVNRMDIYFNNQLRVTYTNDIVANVFGGNPLVWWGLTGSSGAFALRQRICVNANFAYAGADTAVCAGQTLQLNATGGTTYFWGQGFPLISNQNIANPTFMSLISVPTQLTLLVTNMLGCTDRDTMVVNVRPVPTANAGADRTLCLGDSVQIGVAPAANMTYSWAPTTGLSDPNAAQPWVIPTATGATNYTLTITDTSSSANCSDTDDVLVTVNDTPAVSINTSATTACQGDPITLTAVASGGTGSYTYSWSTGGTAATENITATGSGPVTVTVSDGVCSNSASVTLTVNDSAAVTVSSNPDTICAGQLGVLSASPSAGGGGTYFYTWSSGGSTANETVAPLATTTYFVTVTGANSCPGVGTYTLVVNVADSIDIMMPDTFVCNGGSIDIVNVFQTGGIDSWNWNPATGVSDPADPNPTITPPASTLYYLTGQNLSTGCGYTDSIQIDFFQLGISHFSDTTVCLLDSIQFNIQPTGGSGSYSYLWVDTSPDTLSNDTVANPSLVATTSGVYTVMVTDLVNGCVTVFPINVTVSQLQLTVTPTFKVINPGQRVQLEASGAMFYTWTPDTMLNCPTCPDPVVAPNQTITYTVVGTDTSGCRGQQTVTITVDSFLVPSVFTPNGDGINDVLVLNYYGEGVYEILIYDRWGHAVFATQDKAVMWDGRTQSGSDAPEGVYYMAVRVLGDYAIPVKDKQKVFAVTLLR